jgi:Tat protein translocase TatB subunit
MPQVGPLEILVIFVVALLAFGPAKLPGIARRVGRGLRELRNLQDGLRRDLDEALRDDEDDTPGSTRTPTLPPKPPDAAGSDATPGNETRSEAPPPAEP